MMHATLSYGNLGRDGIHLDGVILSDAFTQLYNIDIPDKILEHLGVVFLYQAVFRKAVQQSCREQGGLSRGNSGASVPM